MAHMKIVASLVAVALAAGASAAPYELSSPGGAVAVTFNLDAAGRPTWAVAAAGRPLLLESGLGLELDGSPALAGGFVVDSVATAAWDRVWSPPYGERKSIRDAARELTVHLRGAAPAGGRLDLVFRAYDAGAAVRYVVPVQPVLDRLRVTNERTVFRFAGDPFVWATYSAQGLYEHVALSAVKSGCERPMVVEAGAGVCAAIGEAALVDWARMKFAPLKGTPGALVSELGGPVELPLPAASPWRFVMAAASPGALLENNAFVMNLNEPCALADASWIRPGKVIREVTLTTAGGLACVDYAKRRGLQYIEFDAGWYGHEYDPKSDASAVNLDPKRSKGPLDLPAVVRYAESNGVGVILYVNHLALEKQIDQILPLYRSWGIRGVKYGFVNVGSQKWTAWLHEAVRKAATNNLMVDIHDEYRPTGYSRTYPNLLTQEGIRGDEAKPPAEQTLAILFNRYLAGPADNTICYHDARVDALWSHGFQLAKSVCLYSPWQFLFWYDRPPAAPRDAPGAGGAAPVAAEAPELEFYNRVPTVWDDTRVPAGEIGRYAVVARRSGAEWFVGALNGTEARSLDVRLDFLETGRPYTAHLYTDDPAVETRTKVKIATKAVDATTILRFELQPHNGAAVRIEPAAR